MRESNAPRALNLFSLSLLLLLSLLLPSRQRVAVCCPRKLFYCRAFRFLLFFFRFDFKTFVGCFYIVQDYIYICKCVNIFVFSVMSCISSPAPGSSLASGPQPAGVCSTLVWVFVFVHMLLCISLSDWQLCLYIHIAFIFVRLSLSTVCIIIQQIPYSSSGTKAHSASVRYTHSLFVLCLSQLAQPQPRICK